MLDVSREEITDGSILRSLLILATPLVLQNVVQFAQLVVDALFLGRVGETAVASARTRPAPPTARLPRWTRCQSVA